MDLIEFLRARLDEDEATARAATPGPWTVQWGNAVMSGGASVVPTREPWMGEYAGIDETDAAHIARWDPARVLAEVAAKRQVVDAAEWGINAWEIGGEGFAESVAERVLTAMVQPYADRPGFDPAWLAASA